MKKYRMYQNPMMEFLSLSGPIMMTVFHLLLVSLTCYLATQYYPLSLGWGTLIFACGISTWSLGEYFLHRYLFHFESEGRFMKAFHYAMHGYHHDNPNDTKRLFMPPVPAFLFVLAFFGLFYLIMGRVAFYFTPGFEFGYLLSSFIPFGIHKYGNLRLFKAMSYHHNLHHFKEPDKAYGVSTKLWDRIFGTMP